MEIVPYLDRPVGKVIAPPDPSTPALKQRATLISQTIKALPAMGIASTRDLLYYFPRHYPDLTNLTDFSGLAVGDEVVVHAEVLAQTQRRSHTRDLYIVSVSIGDLRGQALEVVFFVRGKWAAQNFERDLTPGTEAIFYGKVTERRGQRQLSSPDYELLDSGTQYAQASIVHAKEILAVYRGKGKATTQGIRTVIREVLESLPSVADADPISPAVRKEHNLLALGDAFRAIHQPRSRDDYRRARRRFRFEEALVLQTELARRRADSLAHRAQARARTAGGLLDQFDQGLPFSLTRSQREVGEVLTDEISSQTPMLRLLQGDVGAGKTVVALRAMLQVVDAGGQAALLAPTEVLAAQHARSIRALMGDLAAAGTLTAAPQATKVALLTGSLAAAARKQALLDAASGQAGIVVGTHALLGDKVQFADLGLVVVDEQHRFGVEQRDVLRTRGESMPHTLVMTATPIPRTVAMTVFGDLEVSTLRETPARLHARATHVVPEANERWLARTWQRLADEVALGRRGFVVCARISADESDEPDSAAGEVAASGEASAAQDSQDESARELHTVEETLARLRALPALAGVRIGALHGRMTPEDKDRAMAAFAGGDLDVLVSTTVIEVGVDVPEASVMIVLDADRFGISQLHQLRGRVGRGEAPGICLLVSPVGDDTLAGQRMAALARSDDGFVLAEADLDLRKEGDVLGVAQSGFASSLRVIRVVKDRELIEQAREVAREIVAHDPQLKKHRVLAAAIAEKLAGREEFIDRA